MKKKNRRSQTKNAALKPNLNIKNRQELIDFDYLDKLNDKEKAWLNNFVEEEINANFNHTGKILNKTDEEKRTCYNRNNARNRDIFAIKKSHDMLKSEKVGQKKLDSTEFHVNDTENAIIDMLDKHYENEED